MSEDGLGFAESTTLAKLKSILLSLKISVDVKTSIKTIKEKLKQFNTTIHQKKRQLISSLLAQRLKSATYLQSYMRAYKIRKPVQKILKRLEGNYCFVSLIKHVNNLLLKIYLTNGSTQILNFEYCNVRQSFVIYIPKDLITKTSIKVNFIADGKVFIDPNHRTEYEGPNFYNIIEFKKFVEAEKEKQEYIQSMMRLLRYSKVNTKDNDISSSDDEDTDDANIPRQKGAFKGRNSISFNTVHIKYKPIYLIRKDKRVNTVSNLHMLKPILKSPNSKGSLNKEKKVSFTNILTFNY
jgi:hypothetical protein